VASCFPNCPCAAWLTLFFSRTYCSGEVAIVWPPNATDEEKKNRSVHRVELFKMPGGTEYVVHDVDVNNQIIGKARLSGHVKVSENLRVDGFGGVNLLEELKPKLRAPISNGNDNSPTQAQNAIVSIPPVVPPPSFHPPSFGVTVLGNSHGFDASGSVSGFVLWINGRGVMIDPPPYSSATLEREGIRPRTIVGIIITHCHADHDAGTFQKVLTGSPVVLITTPTIYKSFIRKYAALSALSPALLRHSHRYKPAIIGQPLRFQGAVFKFTYSLHTIPCVGFRVEWRGKSIVFTADHFNSPPAIDKLEESGILSKGRADDIRNIPMQDCDLLLHEAGAPPIHTPLDVLMKLPPHIKKRLYVVHTAKLPEGCDLQAAPTGTAGTLRLDEHVNHAISTRFITPTRGMSKDQDYYTLTEERGDGDDEAIPGKIAKKKGLKGHPLVALRPSSSTDAWYILNLMSAVPFLSRYEWELFFFFTPLLYYF
jgi:glyoxylase-like metal-dependent hydrolase (beta-lactamase superfamily II)